jgi:hypothetical protein
MVGAILLSSSAIARFIMARAICSALFAVMVSLSLCHDDRLNASTDNGRAIARCYSDASAVRTGVQKAVAIHGPHEQALVDN